MIAMPSLNKIGNPAGIPAYPSIGRIIAAMPRLLRRFRGRSFLNSGQLSAGTGNDTPTTGGSAAPEHARRKRGPNRTLGWTRTTALGPPPPKRANTGPRLAHGGPQGPPAHRCARLLAVAAQCAGPSC